MRSDLLLVMTFSWIAQIFVIVIARLDRTIQ